VIARFPRYLPGSVFRPSPEAESAEISER